MLAFLKLVRIQNLLLLILLQYFLREFLIRPMLGSFGHELLLSDMDFFLLVLSSVLIASGGYIINDYFDLRIDYVNRPGDVVVGKSVRRRVAMMMHLLLSGAGIAIGFYLAWRTHIQALCLVHPLTVGLLWFYSTDYKRQLIIGNLIISLLSIFPIGLVLLFEPQLFKVYVSADNGISVLIFKVVGFFSMVAFLISLMFALVKDLEDMEGDIVLNCRTIPIVWGERVSKMIYLALAVFTSLALAYVQNMQYANDAVAPLLYILFAVQLPILFNAGYLLFAHENRQYRVARIINGMVMITGACAILVLYFLPG
jgi:4-hydroxybenzoate polyprenyltransferase